MGFRNRIKSSLGKWTQKQWKDDTRDEKRQKYLFGNTSEGFERVRSKKTIFSGKNFQTFGRSFHEMIRDIQLIQDYGYLMSMIGLMLILLSSYIVIFSPYFKISPNQVIIESATPGIDIALAYRSLEGIYGESIFLLDEAAIAKRLQAGLKNLQSVTIDRLYPNGVKILITPSPIWAHATIHGIPEKKWGLSQNGVLVPSKDIGEKKPPYEIILIDSDLIGDLFLSYKEVISLTTMRTIIRLLDVIHSEWTNLTIGKIRYFAGENEVHLTIGSGSIIILALQDESPNTTLDLSKGLTNQLITLRTYLGEHPKDLDNNTTAYIDARIAGKVFVCSNKVICNNNLILIYGDAYR